MVNLLSDIVINALADGDAAMEENLFPKNLTELSKSQALTIRACKKIEQQGAQLEMEFFEKTHNLEASYQSRIKELAEKRANLIQGSIVVAENDVSDVPILYNLHDKAVEQFTQGLKDDTSVKGIPNFWLNVLRACEGTSVHIEDNDAPIIAHLKNIESELTVNPMGVIFRYHFEPNEFFENTLIEQQIIYKLEMNELKMFVTPAIASIKSTPIIWKEGKNPREPGKKDQHSFFSFFDDDEEEYESVVEFTTVLREVVIPHATLYFTGELRDDDISFGDIDSSEDSDSDDEIMELED